MNYKVAIFDMDGTILDTLIDLKNSVNFALKEHGFPQRTYDEVRMFVGNGMPKLIERAVPAGSDEQTRQEVLKTFMAHYEKHCADNTCAYEGIKDLLLALKAKGVKLAVNTNKAQEAALVLVDEYFKGLFDFVAGAVDDRRKKPAPDGVDFILLESGIDKTQAVYIGDSDVDFNTAKNAGINFIGCDWGFRGEKFLREQGAETIVYQPKEILKFWE